MKAGPEQLAILFTPVRLGELTLTNRIVMAPMTRHRAAPETLAPQPLNAQYYRQRASAGLIVTEASQISQQGQGYIGTPGIYTDLQVAGWRAVTDAVHVAGGQIVCQLWHVGRMSHVSLQLNGEPPVAPSAVTAKAHVYIHSGFVDTSAPRELALDEIPSVVASFEAAARNAKRAGFDGVELHGANGYLLDQFMRDGSNKRTDAYGGSVANRIRFTLEIVDAAIGVWGSGRVGIRIAPASTEGDMYDSNPWSLFSTLLDALNSRPMAYVHVVEGTGEVNRNTRGFDFPGLRRVFRGGWIANNGYTPELACEALGAGHCDAVSFGRPFIANPDLVRRFREGAALNATDSSTVYGGDARGYTDYPPLESGRSREQP